jgi:hypothetical protein
MIDQFFTNTFILESRSSGLTTLSSPAQTQAVAFALSEEANIGVRVSGFTTGSGSVQLIGSATETLTFPVNGELISMNTFTSMSTIIINNLTDEATNGIVELFACTDTGSPLLYRTIVGSDYRCRVSNRKRSYDQQQSGVEVNTNPILFTNYAVPAKVKDWIQVVGRTYEIVSINYPANFIGNINHQEIELMEIVDGTFL